MRMKSNARFLLQMLAVLIVGAHGSVMSQTASVVRAKTASAKAETCSFVPASPDGKEQICVKLGAKTAAAAKSRPLSTATTEATSRISAPGKSSAPDKPLVAARAIQKPAGGLALKSASTLRSPPVAKATETAPVQAFAVVPAPPPAPLAVADATAPTAVPAATEAPAPAQLAVAAATVVPAVASAAAPTTTPQVFAAVPAITAPSPATASTGLATAGPLPRATARAGKLRADEAARRFSDGLELERKGETQAAMLAYLDAAESGNGPAQKRLGDIYGTGTVFAERDYGLALKWYERARAQGVEIPKPFTYTGLRQ